MIACKNLSFSYGYEPVFETASFNVGRNEKVGIVGRNGAGKSTLFKLLTKQELPMDGRIDLDGTLAMVPQEVKYDPELTKAASFMDYIDPQHKHSAFEVKSVLEGLELDWKNIGSDLASLSGGQKTKLALARVFLAKPQILLLDEPTNFLDIAGKKWVMHFLGNYPHTLLVVSHDLDLLDQHIKRVLFLNPDTHKIDTYTGNYSAFEKTKKQQDALVTRQVVIGQKHVKRMEAGLVNLRKFTSKKGVHQRVMQERKIERIKDKLPELPKELKIFTAKFPEPEPIGQVAFRTVELSKAFGQQTILNNFSFELLRQERFALIGPNGVGKTTLIKMLIGLLPPDSGSVIRSDGLYLGYYSQENSTFNDSQTLLESVQETHTLPDDKIYAFLQRFLFPVERLKQKIGTLSGGEKTRLAIALLMTHRYNVLILDEPTTYLDVMSQRIILEALKAYQGAILLVSHTEEFVSELKPSRVLLLPEQKIKYWTSDLNQKVVEI